ncbi:PREDICTED: uncharacterized protein LOC106099567 [Papilio polytes]|uniref:uncharacterized protein LOC106099567 n=1 Tax=Papilio polytes TaxID=76194 RepID=UPI000676A2CB|nr:PREDICTED: uncharacterized protein LOC106099567 [Papilio polytes]
MHVKVPEVEKCCFCIPLRGGIIIFGYINIILSVCAVTCLVIRTELQRLSVTNDASLEVVTSTVLFSILGMGVILNILLLVAGYQRDLLMLRLYNYYAVATTLAAQVPIFMLLSRGMLFEVFTALFALLMQCYVIVLVRSEVMKLEQEEMEHEELAENQLTVVVPDSVTLL